MMRSTSPSSGVLSRVRVCLFAVDFFGVVGFGTDGAAGEDGAGSSDAAGGSAAVDAAVGGAALAASLVDLDLSERAVRLMLALDAAKCEAMPLLGAMVDEAYAPGPQAERVDVKEEPDPADCD